MFSPGNNLRACGCLDSIFFEWVPKLARRSFHYVPHDAPQARLFEQPNKETLELLISFDEIQPIAISIMSETCVRGHGQRAAIIALDGDV